MMKKAKHALKFIGLICGLVITYAIAHSALDPSPIITKVGVTATSACFASFVIWLYLDSIE